MDIYIYICMYKERNGPIVGTMLTKLSAQLVHDMHDPYFLIVSPTWFMASIHYESFGPGSVISVVDGTRSLYAFIYNLIIIIYKINNMYFYICGLHFFIYFFNLSFHFQSSFFVSHSLSLQRRSPHQPSLLLHSLLLVSHFLHHRKQKS